MSVAPVRPFDRRVRGLLLFGAMLAALQAGAAAVPAAGVPVPASSEWQKLPTAAYPGKQDDVYFVDERHGWYGNGRGELFASADGGDSWQQVWHQPGTFIRALGFVDAELGFLGNIAPGYFPGVTDATLLYRTRDGGRHWTPVELPPAHGLGGICAIDVLRDGDRTVIHAAGRVGGPAGLLRSDDAGEQWRVIALPADAAMVMDVHFIDADTGFVFAATDADVTRSNALILRTDDAGANWHEVYRSARPYELIWKASFPTSSVGYATVQNYDRDSTRRHVVKTIDGGRSWQELPLVDDAAVREFGIGFVDAERGWVGTTVGGFETRDGGASWQPMALGNAVNKFRFVAHDGEVTGWAIGTELHRWRSAPPAVAD